MIDLFNKTHLKEELKIRKLYQDDKVKEEKAIKEYRDKIKAEKDKK